MHQSELDMIMQVVQGRIAANHMCVALAIAVALALAPVMTSGSYHNKRYRSVVSSCIYMP